MANKDGIMTDIPHDPYNGIQYTLDGDPLPESYLDQIRKLKNTQGTVFNNPAKTRYTGEEANIPETDFSKTPSQELPEKVKTIEDVDKLSDIQKQYLQLEPIQDVSDKDENKSPFIQEKLPMISEVEKPAITTPVAPVEQQPVSIEPEVQPEAVLVQKTPQQKLQDLVTRYEQAIAQDRAKAQDLESQRRYGNAFSTIAQGIETAAYGGVKGFEPTKYDFGQGVAGQEIAELEKNKKATGLNNLITAYKAMMPSKPTGFPYRLTDQVNPKTGNLILLNDAGDMIDSITKEKVESMKRKIQNVRTDELGRNIIIDPLTGTSRVVGGGGIAIPSSAPSETKSSSVKETKELQQPKSELYNPIKSTEKAKQEINYLQTKAVKLNDQLVTEHKAFQSDVGKLEGALLAAEKVRAAILANNPLSMAMIRTQMPRMAGEVGNLNETEQKVWSGDPQYANKLQAFIANKIVGGKSLTPADQKALLGMVDLFYKPTVSEYKRKRDESMNRITFLDNDAKEYYYGNAIRGRSVEDVDLDDLTNNEGRPIKFSKDPVVEERIKNAIRAKGKQGIPYSQTIKQLLKSNQAE